MRVISKKKIRDYCVINPQAKVAMLDWYLKMKACRAKNLIELRHIFSTADPVFGYTIFDIGGNKYRLIAAMHYNMQYCYIRAVWTHAEYSKAINQKKLKWGDL
ncbi:MAG TPA: type II toxin-antitoxin system HigB family toxin [Gammaproteobacteria bacterium]|nr:type II toxin-antitoxin system HigB family toxin [Gammaproteobacteria bacterium]